MPGSQQSRTTTGPVIGQGKRLSTLERKLFPTVDSRRAQELFSFSGALVDDLESPKWRALFTTRLSVIVADLNVAGSGDVLIDLKVDGAVVRTITVPSGDLYVIDSVPIVVQMMSTMTATVTQSSGAEELGIMSTVEYL